MVTKYKPRPVEWFIERIGKRIYRYSNECPCTECVETYKNGLIVMDRQHAEYLAAIDADYAAEGWNLHYHD